MARAIFAGSFDPFTNGHLEIVQKAIPLFDKLYVMICRNSTKTNREPTCSQSSIVKTLSDAELKNWYVITQNNDQMVIDFAKEHNIKYLVRGIRNSKDMEYEYELYQANHYLNQDITTIFIPSDNSYISSTFARELMKYQKINELKEILPKPIFEEYCGNFVY